VGQSFPVSRALDSRRVGYSPQERRSGLFAHLNVSENLTLASLRGLTSWYGLSANSTSSPVTRLL
jgi:ABC-type uncharacterized transport system ATPase component